MVNQLKKLLTLFLAGIIATTFVACDDEPGEDQIGDGEVNDEE